MRFLLPYFIFLWPFLLFHTTAQTYKNITLGSSLIAGDMASSSWLSPSQDFAFGFQEIEPGNFLLAIWFNKIPEKTITWSANRDHLAPSGSKVEVTGDKSLVLTDSNGQEIWRAITAMLHDSTNGKKIAYASMLDTGNFVLASQASDILWQSFDKPTDTLLPTQKLNLSTQLFANFLEKNYSSGRFMFELGSSGSPELYTTNFPIFNSKNFQYWTLPNSASGYQVVFNLSGLLNLVDRSGSILANILPGNVSDQGLYQRVILEYDGVLRHYVYPKQSSSSNGASNSTGWSIKSFVPNDVCWYMIEQTGSGVCGYNSYCKIGEDSKAHCFCPPGYTLLDPNNEMSGCGKNFLPQSCEEAKQEKNHFSFNVMHDVDWPLADYEHYQNVSMEWCKEVCLVDCFCDVAIFKNDGDCWKKKVPLSNGKNVSQTDRTAFIKVRVSGSHSRRSSNRVLIALLGTSGSANIILLGAIVAVVVFLVHRKNLMHRASETKFTGNYNARGFSYKELNEATNGFEEEIGRGAFGIVYKGILGEISGSHTFIAVKKLDNLSRNADKEFKVEVDSIGRTHHRNLVRLIGYCEEEEHRLLVYEFMSNGTLSDFLYREHKPAWEKRLRIAKGIARGLFYLHEDCSTQIIHCDIKPQNILLDDDHNARIADFGLAKLLRLDQTHTSTVARGTRGYLAPEWFNNMPITAKVDVYSFGIMLLEIICCRKNVQGGNDGEEGFSLLTDRALDCYQMKSIDALVGGDTEAVVDMQRLENLVKVAIWCIQNEPNLRPKMRMVVQMLEGHVQVPEPPCPQSSSTSFTP